MSNHIQRHIQVAQVTMFNIGDSVYVVNQDGNVVWRRDNIHEALEYGTIISFWSQDDVTYAEVSFGDITGNYQVRDLRKH